MQREFVFDLVSYIGSTRPALRLGLGMPSEHFYKTRKYNLGLERAWSSLERGPVWSEQCFMFSSVWHDSSNFKYGKYFINVRTWKEHIIISGSFDAAQDQLFFLSTQWFPSKNWGILIILKYFQLPGSALRACEQAWEPTERERCQPPRTPTLISTQWSATPPPPSSSRAPGPPLPAAPTVTSLQVRQMPGVAVSPVNIDWDVAALGSGSLVLLPGDDTTRSR